MQVQTITSNSFGAKNTFLKKANATLDIDEKKYFKSLHCEAKSRLHYLKFKKASEELAEIKSLSGKNAINLIKTIYKVSKEKILSVLDQTDSFHFYPTRFYTADDEMSFPHRFYNKAKL